MGPPFSVYYSFFPAFWLAKYDVYCTNISPYQTETSRQSFPSSKETEAKVLPADKNVN